MLAEARGHQASFSPSFCLTPLRQALSLTLELGLGWWTVATRPQQFARLYSPCHWGYSACSHTCLFACVLRNQTSAFLLVQQAVLPTKPSVQRFCILSLFVWSWGTTHVLGQHSKPELHFQPFNLFFFLLRQDLAMQPQTNLLAQPPQSWYYK